ncbi:DUF4870 domain-containing protein [Natronorarus salvus]|uniref:DUF4870 domain-containing protein n=1 Tax=Natronorarus salvus TaxID=3117733 RepID=UPI002F266FE9
MSTKDADVEAELSNDRIETEPATGDETPTSVGGLDENIVGALAYLFPPLLAIVFYFIEEDNEFVRFHAVQSIIIFGGMIALSMGLFVFGFVLDVIPVVGLLFALLTGLVSLLLMPVAFVLWLVLTYKAYKGDRDGLPVTGDMAKNYV